jgi:hypothetical protein
MTHQLDDENSDVFPALSKRAARRIIQRAWVLTGLLFGGGDFGHAPHRFDQIVCERLGRQQAGAVRVDGGEIFGDLAR